MATATKTTTEPKPKPVKTASPCQCNTKQVGTEVGEPVFGPCGEQTKREFAPGHDARLKGTLIKLHIAGQKYRVKGSKPVEALEAARQRQWGGFLNAAADRAEKRAKATEARLAARAADAEKREQVKAEKAQARLAEKEARAAEREAEKAAKAEAKERAKVAKPAFTTKPGSTVLVKIGRHQYTATVEAEGPNGVTVKYDDSKGNPKTVEVKRSALSAA